MLPSGTLACATKDLEKKSKIDWMEMTPALVDCLQVHFRSILLNLLNFTQFCSILHNYARMSERV
jgi:hypothetical protein